MWMNNRQEIISEYCLQYYIQSDEYYMYSDEEDDFNSQESENYYGEEEQLKGEIHEEVNDSKKGLMIKTLNRFTSQTNEQVENMRLLTNQEEIKEDYENENEIPSSNNSYEQSNCKMKDFLNLSVQNSKEYVSLPPKEIEVQDNSLTIDMYQERIIDTEIITNEDSNKYEQWKNKYNQNVQDEVLNSENKMNESNKIIETINSQNKRNVLDYRYEPFNFHADNNIFSLEKSDLMQDCDVIEISQESIKYQDFTHRIYCKGDILEAMEEQIYPIKKEEKSDLELNVKAKVEGLNCNLNNKKTDDSNAIMAQPLTTNLNKEIILKLKDQSQTYQEKVVCNSSSRNNWRSQSQIQPQKQVKANGQLSVSQPVEIRNQSMSYQPNEDINLSPVDLRSIKDPRSQTIAHQAQLLQKLEPTNIEELPHHAKKVQKARTVLANNLISPDLKSKRLPYNEAKRLTDRFFNSNDIISSSPYIHSSSASKLSLKKIIDENNENISSSHEIIQNINQPNESSFANSPTNDHYKMISSISPRKQSYIKHMKANKTNKIPIGSNQNNLQMTSPRKDMKFNKIILVHNIPQNMHSNQIYTNQPNQVATNPMQFNLNHSRVINQSSFGMQKQGKLINNSDNIQTILIDKSKNNELATLSPLKSIQDKSPKNHETHKFQDKRRSLSQITIPIGIEGGQAQTKFIAGRKQFKKNHTQTGLTPSIIKNNLYLSHSNINAIPVMNSTLTIDQNKLVNLRSNIQPDCGKQQQIQNTTFPANISFPVAQQTCQNQMQQQQIQLMQMELGNQQPFPLIKKQENHYPNYSTDIDSNFFLLMEFDYLNKFRFYYPNYNSHIIIQKANSCINNNIIQAGKKLKRPKNITNKRFSRNDDTLSILNRKNNILFSNKLAAKK